jgi:hypothetical protein
MGYIRKHNNKLVSGELSTIMAIEARRKGKEIAVTEEDETPAQPNEEVPFIHQGTFPLLDLPAELRVYIYQFLLPYNKVLKFYVKPNYSVKREHPITGAKEWSPKWELEITSSRTLAPTITQRQKVREMQMGISRSNQFLYDEASSSKVLKNEIQTQLFLVNKEISKEARGTSPPCPPNPFILVRSNSVN